MPKKEKSNCKPEKQNAAQNINENESTNAQQKAAKKNKK